MATAQHGARTGTGAVTAGTRRSGLSPSIDIRQLAAVFAGGAAGGLVRVALTDANPHAVGAWPWVTFGVNMVAAFLLGALVTGLHADAINRHRLLGTGVCGGLSTFATMQVELLQMIDHDRWGLALGYTGASVGGGLALVVLAIALVREVRVGAP